MPVQSTHFLHGLFFSLTTLLCWATLPIGLKLAADFIDSVTLTWFRFLVALLLVLAWQGYRGQLSEFRKLEKKDWLRLFAAGVFLIINYITFADSLNYLHPGVAQLNFQTAPFYLAAGGLLFLGDKIFHQQWLCFSGIAIGLLLFFHPYILGNSQTGISITGLIIIQISSLSWSLYALLQKALFSKLSPSNILLAIYAVAALTMWPFSDMATLSNLSFSHSTDKILILAFCSLNTLFAYGALSQAMRYWQTVQVSAMIALTPIASFLFAELCVLLMLWPDYIQSAQLDQLSIVGIVIVVGCAVLVQLVTAQIQKRKSP